MLWCRGSFPNEYPLISIGTRPAVQRYSFKYLSICENERVIENANLHVPSDLDVVMSWSSIRHVSFCDTSRSILKRIGWNWKLVRRQQVNGICAETRSNRAFWDQTRSQQPVWASKDVSQQTTVASFIPISCSLLAQLISCSSFVSVSAAIQICLRGFQQIFGLADYSQPVSSVVQGQNIWRTQRTNWLEGSGECHPRGTVEIARSYLLAF